MQYKSYHRQFNEEGYIFIPKLLNQEEVRRILEASNRLHARFEAKMDREHPGRDFTKFSHVVDPNWSSESPDDRHVLLELAASPRCLGPVEQIFERKAIFRSITYWVNPKHESANGNWHRDGQGIRTDEEYQTYIAELKENHLQRGVQFQISLVENSDLEYVPFSAARFDSPEEYHIRMGDNRIHSVSEDGMPNALRFRLQPGDAVAFNQIGLHRGRYHTDKPRRTLMLTYTPDNNQLYDDINFQPWFESPGYLDGLSSRAAVFYQEYIQAYRDFWANYKKSAETAPVMD
jgi:hypothetical protein